MSTAPPHSPPSANPCTNRNVTSSDRRPDAELRVIRQQSDAERRQPHQHQRPHEHRLASEAIAEVTHRHAAERPRDEPDGKCGEGRERAGQVRHLGKELRRKDDGGGSSVDEEVVPLDRRADSARERDAAGIAGGSIVSRLTGAESPSGDILPRTSNPETSNPEPRIPNPESRIPSPGSQSRRTAYTDRFRREREL